MRISFTPRSYGAVPSHGAGLRAGERFAPLSEADEDEAEARLPAGWWILPYALFGIIECVLAVAWITGRL